MAHTPETRKKIAEGVKKAWQEGRLSKLPPRLNSLSSELWRDNLSKAMKRAWAEGRRNSVMTPEVRQKLAVATHQAWLEGKLRAYPRTEQTKHLLSIRTKQAYAEGRLGNDPQLERRRLEASHRAQHRKPNKPEQKLITVMVQHSLPYKYVGDGEFILGGKCPDFLNVNGKKQVIELFGTYWHNVFDIAKRKEHFRQYGFSCLCIWEDELKDLDKVKLKIAKFAKSKQ